MAIQPAAPSEAFKTVKGSDLPPFESKLFLLYGPPGSGKTTSLKTLPSIELEGKTNNTLLLSFDGKFSVLSGCENIDIANLYVDPTGDGYIPITIQIDALLYELREKKRVYPFIALDPLGLIQKVYERQSHDAFPKGGWDRVNHLKEKVWKLISGCMRTGAKIILIAHETAEKTEMGLIQFSHDAFGSLVNDIPIQFHEVWRAYVSGDSNSRQHMWQTYPLGLYPKCASRIVGLPHTIVQDFSLVLNTKWWLSPKKEK